MSTLRDEILGTIARRIRAASSDELQRIIIALTMDELPEIGAPAGGEAVSVPRSDDNRFELIHEDSVVVDRRSGLMWSRENVISGRVDWATANTACQTLRLAGYDDWRLATVDELFALADRTRSDPAINTEYFPNCEPSWYWSSTLYAPSPGGCAWGVDFGYGGAYWSDRGDDGFVRAVRASQ